MKRFLLLDERQRGPSVRPVVVGTTVRNAKRSRLRYYQSNCPHGHARKLESKARKAYFSPS